MTVTEIFIENGNLLNLGKAIIYIVFGVLLGFITKSLLRKTVDNLILKKLFKKDINVYERSSLINKILTEIIQWMIIIVIINQALLLFEFNFISNAVYYIISEIPQMVIFIVIISVGIMISKIISSNIQKRDIEKKEEISLISELVILTAFVFSAFEFLGIKATALIELYKAILYLIVAIIIIFFIKYELFTKHKKKKK